MNSQQLLLLTCSNCTTPIDRSTLRFTSCCSYVVCSLCAESDSILERTQQLNCATCIKEITENRLSSSDELGSLIDEANRYQDGIGIALESQVCGRCGIDNQLNLRFCQTCHSTGDISPNMLLCDQCSDLIHSVGQYVFHSIQVIESGVNHHKMSNVGAAVDDKAAAMRCSIHDVEPAKKTCSKHPERFCEECAANHRRDCNGNMMLIELVERDQRNKFIALTNECTQAVRVTNKEIERLISTMSSMKAHTSALKQRIAGIFQEIFSQLQTQQERIQASFDEERMQREHQIQQHHLSIDRIRSGYLKLKNIAEYAARQHQYQLIQLMPSMPFFANLHAATKHELINLKGMSFNIDIFSAASMNRVLTKEELVLSQIATAISDMKLNAFSAFTQPASPISKQLQRSNSSSKVDRSLSSNSSLVVQPLTKKSARQQQLADNQSNNNSSKRNLGHSSATTATTPRQYHQPQFLKQSSLHHNTSSPLFEQHSQLAIPPPRESQSVLEITSEPLLHDSTNPASLSSLLDNILSNSSGISVNAATAITTTTTTSLQQQSPTKRNIPAFNETLPISNASTSSISSAKKQLYQHSPIIAINPVLVATPATNSISSTPKLFQQQQSSLLILGNNSMKSTSQSTLEVPKLTGASSASSKKSKPPQQAIAVVESSPFDAGSSSTKQSAKQLNNNGSRTNSIETTSTRLKQQHQQLDRLTKASATGTTNSIQSNNARDSSNVPQRESSRSRTAQQSKQGDMFTPVKRSASIAKKTSEFSQPSKSSANQIGKSRESRSSVHEFSEQSQPLQREQISIPNEYDSNPLLKRTITKTASCSSSVKLEWTHPQLINTSLKYAVEFGIGMKISGNEQFKRVYFGPIESYTIEGLQPKTNYRVRVAPTITQQTSSDTSDALEHPVSKTEDSVLQWGEWSDVTTISTQDLQGIDAVDWAQVSRKDKEITVQFFHPGIVTGSFAYFYGKASWEITASVSSHGGGEDINACLIIGVMNKQSKKNQIVGSTVNYGLYRETIKIKVQLDMTRGTMLIFTPSSPQGEAFNNLPQGGLFPAFQNKVSQKSVLSTLKLKVIFE